MNTKYKLAGENAVYLVRAMDVETQFISDKNNRVYTLATLNKDDCNVEFIYNLAEADLVEKINRGLVVQNVNIKNGKIELKGQKEMTSMLPYGYNKYVCLGEIHTIKTPDGTYILIDRQLNVNYADKKQMIALTSQGLVDNYYTTQDGRLSRNPNQVIPQITLQERIIKDTFPEITHEELSDLLYQNGFKLGYNSPVGIVHSPNGQEQRWQAFAWYDSNGAIVFYNALMNKNGGAAFYNGGELYIDVETLGGVSDAIASSVDLGISHFTREKRQLLALSANEGLISRYNALLKAIIPVNPWENHLNSDMAPLLWMCRYDYEQKLKDIAFKLPAASGIADRSKSMFMYSTYHDIATYYTLREFKGEIRTIVQSYIDALPDRIGRNIAVEIVTGMSRAKQSDFVSYLASIKMQLPKPLDLYIKECRQQRESKKQREETSKQRSARDAIHKMANSSVFGWFKRDK